MKYIPIVLALLTAGCTPAQIFGKASQEFDTLWAGYTMYRAEQWDVRRDLRKRCYEDIIKPAVDSLIAQGKYADATKVMKANYPELVLLDILNEAQRESITTALSEMPACHWPEDIQVDAPNGIQMGPFMLVPTS